MLSQSGGLKYYLESGHKVTNFWMVLIPYIFFLRILGLAYCHDEHNLISSRLGALESRAICLGSDAA